MPAGPAWSAASCLGSSKLPTWPHCLVGELHGLILLSYDVALFARCIDQIVSSIVADSEFFGRYLSI
jgi:hypothetical protein